MSGAKKKLAQKEAAARMGLTEKEKQALKEAAAQKRNKILGIVGGVVAVVLVAALLVWNSGVLNRHITALEVNGHKYTVADVNYWYYMMVSQTYQQEQSNASFYQQLAASGYDLGDFTYTPRFDITADFKTQYMDDEQTQSYHDYFLEQAKAQLTSITAMADAAKAEGYTLSEDAQADLDGALDSIDSICQQYNYASRSAYFRTNFGRGMNQKVYMDNLELNILGSDYGQTSTAAMTADSYSEEDLRAYYNEHTDLYNSYDYDYAFFSSLPATQTDEDGAAIPATDEETAQAKEDAKAKAEGLLNDVKAAADSSFAEVAVSYTLDNTVRTRNLGYNFQNSAYFDWLTDASRKDGDIELFEVDSGYYVIQFHDAYFYDEPTVDVRHILIRAETSEGAEVNEYGVAIPTQEQMDAAHDEAEELLKQFNLGEQTAEAFGELAEEHSDDGRNTDGDLNASGGLYTDIHKGDMVQNFNDWIFDPARTVGSTGLVENAGPGYYGWHVVYFQASYDPAWMGDSTTGARAAKATEDQNSWLEKVEAGYEAVEASGFSRVGR